MAARVSLLVVVFASGACGLAYELLWMRMATATLGVTLLGTTAVLAAFMGGLAVGSKMLGARAERMGNPLVVYGGLEIGIGICALAVPVLLDAIADGSVGLTAWSPALRLTVRFGSVMAVLSIPAILMGGLLPVLVRSLASKPAQVGSVTAWLYATHTLGAVVGVLAATLWLLPNLGVTQTNTGAVGLNLALGFAALWLAPKLSRRSPLPAPSPTADASNSPWGRRVAVLAGLSGFAALSYEVLWFRGLSMLTYDSPFAFAAMLAAFLSGIVLGSYVLAAAIGNRTLGVVAGLRWFAVLQVTTGLYAVASPAMFGALTGQWGRGYDAEHLGDASWAWVFVAKQFAMASATMLIPATLLGASLPLACAIHARLTAHVASSTGSVFAANTLGGILGTMITGIVLVPTFGFDTSLAAAASVSVAAGCLAWGCTLLVRRDERTRLLPWLGLIGALGMWIWAVRAAPPLPLGIDGIGERIFVAEDASGRVEVHERAGGFRTLVSDGTHRWGSTDPPMLQGMHRQGYLPLLLHPEPRRIVEIGLATGINLAPALAYDAVRSVTVVEVSPAIVRAAELFAEHNGGLVGHPKVDLVVDDGFSYLHHTEQRFDVIIIGLLTPYRSGAGNLFSVEMYRACARRLDAQGILVHWLPLNQLTPEGLRAIVRTFQEVFPNLHLWERGHYVALVGLEEGVELDYAAVASAMRDPSIAEDLRTWKLDDPLAFFSAYLMGPDEARTFAEGAPLSSRDHPVTEFSRIRLDWALSYRYAQENLEALLPHRTSPTRSMGSAQPDLHAALERVSEARSWSLQGALLQSQGHHRLAIDRFVRAIELNPTEEIATQELTKYEAALRSKKMGTPTSR